MEFSILICCFQNCCRLISSFQALHNSVSAGAFERFYSCFSLQWGKNDRTSKASMEQSCVFSCFLQTQEFCLTALAVLISSLYWDGFDDLQMALKLILHFSFIFYKRAQLQKLCSSADNVTYSWCCPLEDLPLRHLVSQSSCSYFVQCLTLEIISVLVIASCPLPYVFS